MEVGKSQFKEALPIALKAIREASFISMDTELTGLTGDHKSAIDWLDSSEKRYEKLRNTCDKIMITQLGICTFKWIPTQHAFQALPITFHVFPGQFGRSVRFTCESSAFHFVSQHGFDFNTWVKEGVSWLVPREEEKLMKEPDYSEDELWINTEQDQVFLDNTFELVAQWLDGGEVVKGWTQEGNSLIMPSCNSYRRRLLFQEVPKKFPGVYAEPYFESKGRNSTVKVLRLTESELVRRKEEKRRAYLAKLDEAVGIRHIIDQIMDVNVPVIVHNGYLDLGIIFRQFLGPLPDTYAEYKEYIHAHLSTIVDTKHIVKSSSLGMLFPTERSSLSDCHKAVLTSSLFKNGVQIKSQFKLSEDKYHQAGYDAYATGVVYARLSEYLGESMMLKRVNCVNVIRCDGHMAITEDDPHADRSHVFVATGISPTVTTRQIQKLLIDHVAVRIQWLDSGSALIIVKEEDKVSAFKSEFCNTDKLGFHVTEFDSANRGGEGWCVIL